MKHPVSYYDPPPQMSPQERNARILSVLGYLGLAPVLWLFGSFYRRNRLLEYHTHHGLAYGFLSLCILSIELIPDAFLYAIFGPDLETTLQPLRQSHGLYWVFTQCVIVVVLLAGLASSIAWCISVWDALSGRMTHLPIVSRVASMMWAVNLGAISSLASYLAVLILVGVGLDSMKIANARHSSADVYVLYTVGGYIPTEELYETYTPPGWTVTMAFYPLVRAGMARFGDDRVSVLPLTEANFNEAIHYGRFIFLASHGGLSPGTFASVGMPTLAYGPANVPQEYVGESLQFVYFAGCDAGHLESEWRRVLRLDDAIMFDRTSWVDEHMLWIWFKSPEVIAGLD